MGVNDGRLVPNSLQKIVDHGPSADRWNLLLLSEGYKPAEIPQFHTDAQAFATHLSKTPPFDRLWCAVNVYTFDVESTESGADDPKNCPDDPSGSGATPKTFYDATFCNSSTRRLLYGDSARAQSDGLAQFPDADQVMVIVNTPIYGGAGGNVAWFSTNASAGEIGVHEMGHSFFGFADEYGDAFSTYSGLEPMSVNATIDTNRTTIKWRDLIAASTAVPTQQNPSCNAAGQGPSPVPAGTVGLFEGGSRYFCGIYHPEYDCKMQHLGVGFCAVCTREIGRRLEQFIPAGVLRPTASSVDFGNVPDGVGTANVTTYRPLTFELTDCGPVTLEVSSGPTGAFGIGGPTSITIAPSTTAVPATGRFWISFTTTTPGTTSTGTVTIRWRETGRAWTVNLAAKTVARPKTAIALVLDHSGSMSEDSGDGTPKVGKLKQAVSTFVGLMLPGDGIGVVRFDDSVQRLLSITDVGPVTPVSPGSGRDHVNQIVAGNQLDPVGATSIGGGVAEGKAVLDSAPATTPPWAVKAMVVVTDGVENTSPFLAQVTGSITANTFAIGIGQPANISVTALDKLTQNHGGYVLVTGAITQEQTFRLTKYFVQALAGVTNASVVLDPSGALPVGAEHRIPFRIGEADMMLDAIVLAEAPGLLDVELEAPDGNRIDAGTSAPTVEHAVLDHACLYRVQLPALSSDPEGSHAGTWQLVLRLDKRKLRGKRAQALLRSGKGLAYEALVHAHSQLTLDARLHQPEHTPQAEALLTATLLEYAVLVERRARVWAEVTDPKGLPYMRVRLDEVAPGRFRGRFPLSYSGAYPVRVRAEGVDLQGNRFTREQALSATVWVGEPEDQGDQPPKPARRRRRAS